MGPWLHRVAHRVATRARSSAIGRREHERRTAATRPALVSGPGDREDLEALLHQEIDRLPERYRVPVVLCDLQGLTHEKAARHLGWPVGTVKSRLARARELLRGRLSHRGLGLSAGLPIAEKGPGGAFRAVEVVLPGALVESTVRAAVPFAAGKALAVGVISSRAAILIEEVLKTMFLTKLRLASVVVLLFGAAGAAVVLAQPGVGSGASPGANQPEGPAAPASASAPSPAPAYITQSRVMIITRLEEEVAEARARLDRSLRKVRSPDDPAVVLARKTLQDLQQRLDRIDRVLVDVVETYPTMVDFSGGPSDFVPTSQSAAGPNRNTEVARNGLAAASQAGQPQQGVQQGGPKNQQSGLQQGQPGQGQSQGRQGNGQRQQGQGQGQKRQEGNSQGQSQGQGQQGSGAGQGKVQGQQGNFQGQQGQGQGQQGNGQGQQGQGQQGQGQPGQEKGNGSQSGQSRDS